MTLRDDDVVLPGGLRLAVRTADGGPGSTRRAPYLLVHGLASNARLWDGVSRRLAEAGHDVVAVDQRGHGRSDAPEGGYDTATCAADLAALCTELGLVGDRAPVVAGQSWGGNVVLTLAAVHRGVRGLALVDGGWLTLSGRYATFEECWAELAPPSFDGLRYDDLAERIRAMHPDWPDEGLEGTLANLERRPDGGVRARLDRDHHRDILRSLWLRDPGELYPLIDAPALLLPATDPAATDPRSVAASEAVLDAARRIPRAQVRWYAGADHDLHAQHPQRVAADLLELRD